MDLTLLHYPGPILTTAKERYVVPVSLSGTAISHETSAYFKHLNEENEAYAKKCS